MLSKAGADSQLSDANRRPDQRASDTTNQRWEHVDLESDLLFLPNGKTGYLRKPPKGAQRV